MATRKNKNNTISGDFDLDGDLDFGKFDFNEPSIKDDRKPIVRAAISAAKGAAKAPRDSAFLKRTLRESLPRGFGQSWDTADQVAGSVRNLYDESVKEIKPAIRESKRVISKLVPRESKILPKSVQQMLKRWDEEAKSERAAPSMFQQRESSINSQLADVFKAQMEHTVATEAERQGRDRLKEGIEITRHRDLSNLLTRSAISLDKLQKYQTSVTLGYQKKSLELQMRHLFTMQDMLAFMKEDAQKRDAFLMAISKNTTLPDSVKANSKEAREAMGRNALNSAIHKGLYGDRDRIVERTLGRVSDLALAQVRGLAGGLQAGAQMSEMGADLGAGLPGDKYAMAGEEAGRFLGQSAGRFAAGRAKKALNSGRFDRFGGKKVLQAGYRLENMNENMSQRLNAFRNSDKYLYDDSMKGGAMRFLQMLLPGMGPELGLRQDRAQDLDSPSMGTKRTNRSITEVIPGYLARILRELQVTRTGNTKIELTDYSWASNKFTSKGKNEGQIFKEIINGKAAARTNQQLDELLKQIDPQGKLSTEARAALKKKLLTNSTNVKEANRDNLAMYGAYGDVKDNIADEIVPVMREFFGNLSDDKKGEFSRANNSLASSIADPREAIQRQVDWGNMSYLKRMGFVDGTGKNVDMGKIVDYILDPNNAESVQQMAAGKPGSAGGSAFQSMARNLNPQASIKDRFNAGLASVKGSVSSFAGMTPSQMAAASKNYAQTVYGKGIKITDVYVAGESDPRILAAKLQAGVYRDRFTKQVIKSVHDIKGAVEDTSDNNAVVVENKDVERLSTFDPVSQTFEKVETATSNSASAIPTNLTDLGKLIQRKGAEVAANDEVMDVYVEGEAQPRMTAVKMRAGQYRDAETGKVIAHQSEINGDVRDEDDKTVIGLEDIPKLRVWDRRQQRFGLIKKLGNIAAMFAKGIWAVQKFNTRWAMWNVKKLWGVTKAIASGTKATATRLFGNPVRDVFVQGEPKPRMYAARMRAGDYRDAESGERITHQDQITGAVIDRNDEIVLDVEDLDKLQVYNNVLRIFNPFKAVKWLAKKAGKALWWAGKQWQTKVAPAITKAALKVMGQTLRAVTRIVDVCVKGDPEPRMFAWAIRQGKYFLAATGKVIKSTRDIVGRVVDAEGNTVLSDDEVRRGLTRVDGKPLFGGPIGALARGLGNVNRLMSLRVKLQPGAAKNASTAALLKNKAVTAGDKTVILLQDIKDIFAKKFGGVMGDGDGDGLRDGSWQSRLKNKVGLPAGALSTVPGKEAAAGGGLLAGLKSLFSKKKAEDEDEDGYGVGDALEDASNADDLLDGRGRRRGRARVRGKGRLGRLTQRLGGVRGLVKGAGAAAVMGAAAYGADGLLGKLGAGGNELDTRQDDANWEKMNAWEKLQSGTARGIEKIGSFAFLDNAANSAAKSRIADETAYMQGKAAGTPGKGLLDYLVMATPLGLAMGAGSLFGQGGVKSTAYDELRYTQYGFQPNNKTARERVSAMEDYLQTLAVGGETVTLDESKLDVKRVMSPWGFDPANKKELEVFFGWYTNRFKPVFLAHLNAVKKFTGKADLRNVAGVPKEQQASYLEAISLPGGPYDYSVMPDPSGSWFPTSAGSVKAAVERAYKDLGVKKGEKTAATTAAVTGAAVAGAAVALDANGKPKMADFNASSLAGAQSKLPSVGVTGASAVGKADFMNGGNVSALEAVRFRVYGLTEMDSLKVQALRGLERHLANQVKFGGDGKATWDGLALAILGKVQGSFGIGDTMGKDAHNWTQWFKNRFLPAYLAYLSSFRNLTGKTDLTFSEDALKASDQVQVAKLLVGLSGIWDQQASPWPGVSRLADSDEATKENIAFLEGKAKEAKLQEQKLSGKSGDSAEKPGLWARTTQAVKNFFSSDKKETTKLPEVTSPDAEAPSKGAGSAVSPVAAAAKGGSGIPALAAGDISDGRNADAFIALKSGVSLDGMHPEFLKNFKGMVEEYGKITGKKVSVNDAFRSYQAQAAMKQKYGARAAAPGSSLHEFGLAMDIDTKTLDELDKMGLMRKYGFTRPVGGEGWHMEPIGIQANIAKYKKDQDAAAQAIASGVGRGGGGFGTVANAPKYSRNRDLAMSIYQSGGAATVDNTKPGADGLQPANTPGSQPGGATIAQGVSPAPSSSVLASGGKLGVDGGFAASQDGEAKPQGGGAGGTANLSGSGLSTRPASMPADPSVKVPDPKGSGYGGLKDTIEAAAKMVGVDPDTLTRMAAIESSFNPSAKASTSSATGLFQFTKDTWRAMIAKYGQKYGYDVRTPATDPKASAIMAAHMLKDAAKFVGSKIKGAFGTTEAYMTHFLGQGGAVQFLQGMEKNPQGIAAEAMPKAANANQSIFFDNGRPRTFQEVYALLSNKVNGKMAQFGVPNAAKSNAALAASSTTSSSTGASAPAGAAAQASPGASNLPPAPPTGQASAAPSMADQSGSPIADAYGFKPAQALQRAEPQGQPSQLDASVLQPTNDILAQSLDVQKQMLTALTSLVSIMGGQNQAAAPAAAPAPGSNGKASSSDYTVPKGPVQMKRALA